MDPLSFNCGPIFGVPLTPFPPGMRWNTTREMLHEVMIDLYRGWVQDYLFQQNAQEDARVLSTPSKLCQSTSFTFTEHWEFNSDCSSSSGDVLCPVLLVPGFKKDDISTGICLEHQYGDDAPPEVIGRTKRFAHGIINNRTGAICTISFDEEGVVELFFFSFVSLSKSWHVLLKLQTSGFEKSFAPGSIDFDTLERSIVFMTVGYASVRPGTFDFERSEYRGPSDNLPESGCVGSAKLSLKNFIQFGECYCTSVTSCYRNGVPMKASSIFSHAARAVGAPSGVIDKMVSWAMMDRLSRLQPVVPYLIQFPFESEEFNVACSQSLPVETLSRIGVSADDVDKILLGETFDASDGPLSMGTPQIQSAVKNVAQNALWQQHSSGIHDESSPRGFGNPRSIALSNVHVFPNELPLLRTHLSKRLVPIAPAPSITPKPISKPSAGTALMESMEKVRLTKLEQRNIRKREAAFRSNAKRRERRQIAQLLQEKRVAACSNAIDALGTQL